VGLEGLEPTIDGLRSAMYGVTLPVLVGNAIGRPGFICCWS
jgi:hypothetical protein